MYAYTQAHIYIYTHTHTHLHTHTYIYIHRHIYTHTYAYATRHKSPSHKKGQKFLLTNIYFKPLLLKDHLWKWAANCLGGDACNNITNKGQENVERTTVNQLENKHHCGKVGQRHEQAN